MLAWLAATSLFAGPGAILGQPKGVEVSLPPPQSAHVELQQCGRLTTVSLTDKLASMLISSCTVLTQWLAIA